MVLKRKSTWQKPGLTVYILSCEFLKKNITKKEYKIRSMQWITVAKVQWNFFVFKTSLAGIMILYLLTWRPSSAGDGTETFYFRYWCGDLGSGECDDCCPCILQMISISVTVHLFCML